MPDTKHLQIYQSLSTEFYDLHKSVVAAEEFGFYLDYVKGCQEYAILEPMCGSGRFLIPIYEAGFEIEGFDASSFMLDALSNKCQAKNLRPIIWQSFLQELNSSVRYGLIFIPDGSVNLILDVDELKLSFNKIYEHLLPGGTFVFELVTSRYADNIQVGASNILSVLRYDGKRIIQNVEVLPFNGPIARTFSHYKLFDNNASIQSIRSETEVFQLYLHNPEDIQSYLEEAGFRNIKHLKPFKKDQMADSDDPIIIFECIT